MKFKKHGIYIIKDEFFEKMNDPNLPFQKKGRPTYYGFPDKKNEEILWMIPLTTRLDKVNKAIEKSGGEEKCLLYVKNSVDKKTAFNIGDAFPITEKYLEKEYTIKGKHYVIHDKKLNEVIEKKAKKNIYSRMIKHNQNRSNIYKIYQNLEKELSLEKKQIKILEKKNPLLEKVQARREQQESINVKK